MIVWQCVLLLNTIAGSYGKTLGWFPRVDPRELSREAQSEKKPTGVTADVPV